MVGDLVLNDGRAMSYNMSTEADQDTCIFYNQRNPGVRRYRCVEDWKLRSRDNVSRKWTE